MNKVFFNLMAALLCSQAISCSCTKPLTVKSN